MMRITIKTAGLLSRHLPPGSTANSAEIDVAEGATPVDVMRQLGIPLEGTYLVMLNGATLPAAEHGGRHLAAGDDLAIMPPLKGG